MWGAEGKAPLGREHSGQFSDFWGHWSPWEGWPQRSVWFLRGGGHSKKSTDPGGVTQQKVWTPQGCYSRKSDPHRDATAESLIPTGMLQQKVWSPHGMLEQKVWSPQGCQQKVWSPQGCYNRKSDPHRDATADSLILTGMLRQKVWSPQGC